MEMLTDKEVFLKVRNHLRTQGRAAVGPGGHCEYRTADGRKCAAGCLIPDEKYSYRLEGKNVFAATSEVPDLFPTPNDKLLASLQVAHDNHLANIGMYSWEERMTEIAEEFNIDVD